MKNRLYEYEADTQRMQQENALENEKVNITSVHVWMTHRQDIAWDRSGEGCKFLFTCTINTYKLIYTYILFQVKLKMQQRLQELEPLADLLKVTFCF